MVGRAIIRSASLETKREKSGAKLRDMELWDFVWVPEERSGLLVKVQIVHRFHVPGAYTEAVSKYESDPDKIVWAKHDIGNGHFSWFALYADSEAEIAPEGVTESDKFLANFKRRALYRPPDETTRDEFIPSVF